MDFDIKLASNFLEALDELSNKFTFQTFDDDKNRKDPALCKVLHGTIDEHWDTLVELNTKGAGIFVTVNETDLKGRKASNITSVRAFYIDDDGEVNDPPIEPNIIVKTSPNNRHLYYLIENTEWKDHD